MILAMPTLEENIVLIQSSLFTLMIIVVCKLDYLMYIKYVNTGDSSLTAERSFFTRISQSLIFEAELQWGGEPRSRVVTHHTPNL